MTDHSHITVFLLAAGLGTRLRPITDTVPKVMVPIYKDHPLLEHTLLQLRDQGFRRFVINLHYLPDVIRSYFGDGSRFGVSIVYSDESAQALETGGAIKKALPLLSDPFLFVYADHLFFFDFAALLKFHEDKHAYASILLKRSDLPENGELAEVNSATSEIIRWHARPHGITDFGDRYYLNTGIDILPKSVVDGVPLNTPVRFDKEVLPLMIEKRQGIFGLITDIDILDLGTPDKYEFAKQYYIKHLRQSPF